VSEKLQLNNYKNVWYALVNGEIYLEDIIKDDKETHMMLMKNRTSQQEIPQGSQCQ